MKLKIPDIYNILEGNMFKLTEYELKKKQHKRELVRNELRMDGQYQIPFIKKQDIDMDTISLLSYTNAKNNDAENAYKTIHFFTYDWLFDKVYDKAFDEIEKLKQYYALLSPDFSIFTDMPKALQIYSVFKNRWCGAFWQSLGLRVIPTISWGDKSSFEFCFDGVEQGSVVAVCTYYRENNEEEFMLGYNRMLEVIKPSSVVCYDEPFKTMKGNIKSFLPTTYEWTNSLDWKEKAKFYIGKHSRNVIGSN
ncbi:MAG: DUF4417 domain-containing protein [Clostridia bacterium]|nr:DUF4417 domain-containing protein [Clostridia bacterium]